MLENMQIQHQEGPAPDLYLGLRGGAYDTSIKRQPLRCTLAYAYLALPVVFT